MILSHATKRSGVSDAFPEPRTKRSGVSDAFPEPLTPLRSVHGSERVQKAKGFTTISRENPAFWTHSQTPLVVSALG